MDDLAAFQQRFSACLQGAASGDFAAHFVSNGVAIERRLDVYRNNVMHGLITALADAFPVVKRLVGEVFFAAMAREFIASALPVRPTLVGFGSDLPEFLDRFEPVRALVYLGDVARLEALWLEAYHSPDASPLNAVSIAGLPFGSVAELRFIPHPSLRLLASAYPVDEIWRTNREDESVRHIDLSGNPAHLAIVRPAHRVEVRRLSPAAFAFLEACSAGRTISIAADDAVTADENFDLACTLFDLIRGGYFAAVRTGKESFS